EFVHRFKPRAARTVSAIFGDRARAGNKARQFAMFPDEAADDFLLLACTHRDGVKRTLRCDAPEISARRQRAVIAFAVRRVTHRETVDREGFPVAADRAADA